MNSRHNTRETHKLNWRWWWSALTGHLWDQQLQDNCQTGFHVKFRVSRHSGAIAVHLLPPHCFESHLWKKIALTLHVTREQSRIVYISGQPDLNEGPSKVRNNVNPSWQKDPGRVRVSSQVMLCFQAGSRLPLCSLVRKRFMQHSLSSQTLKFQA